MGQGGGFINGAWHSDCKCKVCSLPKLGYVCYGRHLVCKSCGGSTADVHLCDLTAENRNSEPWVSVRADEGMAAWATEGMRLRKAAMLGAEAFPSPLCSFLTCKVLYTQWVRA